MIIYYIINVIKTHITNKMKVFLLVLGVNAMACRCQTQWPAGEIHHPLISFSLYDLAKIKLKWPIVPTCQSFKPLIKVDGV